MAKKTTILVVEDDMDVAEMLRSYFQTQGYEGLVANWGEDAVKTCLQEAPDLVVLDIRLPDIDGYEVARQLRSHRRTESLPILFLTERRDRTDKLRGLELGAVDYITKPFDMTELRLRVRNALRRAQMGAPVNATTGLPEGAVVDERLSQILKSGGWGVLIVSIRGLDDFRETYGFVASDDVLRAASLLINNALREVGTEADFLGHLSPDDLVAIVRDSKVRELRERVSTRLGQSVEYFYPLQHRSVDRQPPEGPLGFATGTLLAADGPFDDLNRLKTAILRSRSTG